MWWVDRSVAGGGYGQAAAIAAAPTCAYKGWGLLVRAGCRRRFSRFPILAQAGSVYFVDHQFDCDRLFRVTCPNDRSKTSGHCRRSFWHG